jgi:hypothetical protein
MVVDLYGWSNFCRKAIKPARRAGLLIIFRSITRNDVYIFSFLFLSLIRASFEVRRLGSCPISPMPHPESLPPVDIDE